MTETQRMGITRESNETGTEFIKSCAHKRDRLRGGGKTQAPQKMAYAPSMALPTSWCWASVSDICERVSVGHVGPTSEHFTSDLNGIPLIRSQNVRPGVLDASNALKVNEEFHQRLKKSQLAAGDVLIVRVGANRGDVARVGSDVGPINCANIIFARPLIDTGFIEYFLRSHFGREALLSLTTGSAQGVINTGSVAKLPIPVPPEAAQRQITSILSAYDDLIAKNIRRIEILEEMARHIYSEWVANCRFPGHENEDYKDSEFGRIPEGWAINGLHDIAEVTFGYPFKAKQFNDQGRGLGAVRIRDIRGGRVKTYTTEEGKPQHIIKNGDILVGMDGQFHLGKWSGGEAWLVQRVAKLRPKMPMSRYLLFLTIERPIKHLEETIVGTTVAHLSAKDLKSMRFVIPDERTLRMMAELLEPMYELEIKLKLKNENLRAQRDLLLPKLVSGEIDASEIPMPDGREVEAA